MMGLTDKGIPQAAHAAVCTAGGAELRGLGGGRQRQEGDGFGRRINSIYSWNIPWAAGNARVFSVLRPTVFVIFTVSVLGPICHINVSNGGIIEERFGSQFPDSVLLSLW